MDTTTIGEIIRLLCKIREYSMKIAEKLCDFCNTDSCPECYNLKTTEKKLERISEFESDSDVPENFINFEETEFQLLGLFVKLRHIKK